MSLTIASTKSFGKQNVLKVNAAANQKCGYHQFPSIPKLQSKNVIIGIFIIKKKQIDKQTQLAANSKTCAKCVLAVRSYVF